MKAQTMHNFQTSATSTGVGTPFYRSGHSVMTVQVAGVTTATIAWQATLDRTNWVAMEVTPVHAIGTPSTTSTGNEIVRFDISGLAGVRANITAYTAGTINITGMAESED